MSEHYESPASPPSPHLFSLYLATVAVYADMYITQSILPLLSQEFGVQPATAGLTISAVVLAIAISSGAYGPLGDSLGRKPVMVWSCALLAIPTLLCAFAPTFPLLLLSRTLQGLLVPGVSALAVAYIGDLADSGKLGSMVGGFIAASVAGGLVGRVGSGLVTDFFSWQAAFVVFSATTLAGAAAMAVSLPRGPVHKGLHWLRAYRDMFRHLGDRRLVGAFIIGGALFFGFIGVFTYLPYYLTRPPFGLSTAIVSGIYIVYLAGIITSPLAGRLSARFSRRLIMGVGLVMACLGVGITLVASLPVILLGLVVLVVGMFAAQGTAPAYVNATARTARGGANALYFAFYYVGATIGSVLPGYALQAIGWPGVAATCAAAFLIALLADWLLCR
ncbi:MAG: MFS transporter [Rudaea sp.]